MRDIVISTFGGILPRHSNHMLDKTQATYAQDVKLRNGILEPWLEPCTQESVASSTKMIYVLGNNLHTWNKIVQIAETSRDWGRSYITGHNSYPEVMVEACDGTLSYYHLGVPAPTDPLVLSGTESCDRSSDARSYCYTFVNKWGEESGPSPVSDVILVKDGASVQLSGFSTAPSGYAINRINIYRAVSGAHDIDPKKQTFQSGFLFVKSISSNTSSTIDDLELEALSMPLDTEDVNPPPDKLSGIVSIDDLIRLAGYYENRIYFSENTELHNWPVKYELTIDDMIVHMEQSKQLLFITTNSYPYIINTVSQDGCSPVIKSKAPFPDIACSYPHSHLMVPQGLIYVSLKGLVLLQPDATIQVLTAPWFDSTEWGKLAPDTARLGLYEGYLFCTTDNISFILDLWGNNSYADIKGGELTTITNYPVDYFRSNTGDLYFLEKNKVKIWDRGTTYRKFLWESRELTAESNRAASMISLAPTSPKPRSVQFAPTTAKVKSKSTTFTLYYSINDDKAYSRHVSTEEPFRLPRFGRHSYYRVRFTGTEKVEFFSLGTSNFTVNDGV